MTQTDGKLPQVKEELPSLDTKHKRSLRDQLQSAALRVTYKGPQWSAYRFLRAHPGFQTCILSIIIFLIALGFNLYRLGSPGIWFDEAFSVELARQPLPLIWHIIWGPEPNMELYYLFLHFWLGFTGLLGLLPTEFVVRFPSAVFAALSSVMVFLLGRRFIGITGGIVAASLYLLNYLQLVYAQQTRAYSLQLLLICIAWYALFAAITVGADLSRPSPIYRPLLGIHKRWWLCFIAATTLAIYSHLFSLLILLAQLVAFSGLLILPGPWRTNARRQLKALIISLVSIGALSIPMLLVSLHGPKTGWLPSPHLHDIYNLFLIISGGADSKIYLLAIVACCAFGFLISLQVYLTQGTNQQFLPVAIGLGCWLVVPIVFSYIVSQGSIRLFSSRYLVTIVPPLFLLVGLGIATLRWRMLQIALSVVLVLLAVYYVPVYYRSAQVEDWNSTIPWLEHHYQTGDGLVCYDSDVQQGCQVSVEYYLHAYPGAAHFTNDSPGAFSWQNFAPADPHSGPEAAVNPDALAAYGAKHPHIFYILGRIPDNAAGARAQAAQQWLDSHYHLIDRIVTPTVTISLYATNAGG